ncbi:MAG: Sua5/YciO/YrdC/YwlC family protein, partial [Bryobacteraceae bacterium]
MFLCRSTASEHDGGYTRHRILLEGVVQGVGFRPFVKRLADRFQLPGITFNTASGLVIEIDSAGRQEAANFVDAVRAEAPAASKVDRCTVEEVVQELGYRDFRIIASSSRDRHFTLISADLAICAMCAAEISDPANRRFQYAFTNCTNCGPRYSITESTPYDRASTTMKRFQMCPDCALEYSDPSNRRYHAEPIACAVCGPRLSMELSDAIAALESGRIVAIKGLGGFQLACDAFRSDAVDELRIRKRRSRKPFAVMMRDLATVERFCVTGAAER